MKLLVTLAILECLTAQTDADVYRRIPYDRLINRFGDVLKDVKDNNGVITAQGMADLEQLRQDMVEDCSSGKLIVYIGKERQNYQNDAGIPSKAYEVRVSIEVTQDTFYWVLPDVQCEVSDDQQFTDERRTSKLGIYFQIPYSRLLNKYGDILNSINNNNGVKSEQITASLGELKQDMLDDCASGKLQEYAGNEHYDLKNNAGIPNKVYRLKISKEVTQNTYYWLLPEVDCNGLTV